MYLVSVEHWVRSNNIVARTCIVQLFYQPPFAFKFWELVIIFSGKVGSSFKYNSFRFVLQVGSKTDFLPQTQADNNFSCNRFEYRWLENNISGLISCWADEHYIKLMVNSIINPLLYSSRARKTDGEEPRRGRRRGGTVCCRSLAIHLSSYIKQTLMWR